MAIPLPEKYNLNGQQVKDLSVEDKLIYDKRVAEEAKRKDASQSAQEALDCYYELINSPEGSQSPSVCFTKYGYSLRVVKAALAEEQRIIRELAVKPSADVIVNPAVALSVTDVQTKYSIDEFVPIEPEVIE